MPIDSQIVELRSLFSDGCQQEGGSGEAWLRTAGEWIKLAQSVEQRGRQPHGRGCLMCGWPPTCKSFFA